MSMIIRTKFDGSFLLPSDCKLPLFFGVSAVMRFFLLSAFLIVRLFASQEASERYPFAVSVFQDFSYVVLQYSRPCDR